MARISIDLNSDVAEGFGRWELGDDEAMVSVVSSANLACGFHAGDPLGMQRTCALAARRGVAVGAQVGYRDLAGFGRRFIDIEPDALAADVLYQIGALDAIARSVGTRVTYVKPHGELYNAIVHHEDQAAAVARAVAEFGEGLPVLGLPGSVWLRRAEEAGLRPVAEAFADRAYTPDATLVPRREPGAVLADADQVAQRCVRLARDGEIEAIDGSVIHVAADSICTHGDSAGAVEMARQTRAALEAEGIRIKSFVDEVRGADPTGG